MKLRITPATGLVLVVFIALGWGPAGRSSARGDDLSPPDGVPSGFQPGDISIGESIPLPSTTPRTEAAVPSPPVVERGEPRSLLVDPSMKPASAEAPSRGTGWLGLVIAEAVEPGRWTVDEVAVAGPAAAAGIAIGDEVRAIDGIPLHSADDVSQAMTAIAPGQRVGLAIARGGQVTDVVLVAVDRPVALTARTWQGSPEPAPAEATPPHPPAFAQAPPPFVPPVEAGTAVPPPPSRFASPRAVVEPPQPPASTPQPPSFAQQPAESAPRPPAFAQQPPSFVQQPPASAPQPPSFTPQPPSFRAAPAAAPYAGPAPAQAATGPMGRTALGVRTIAIDPALQSRFQLPDAAGAYVIGVVQDLPAAQAGVPPGSVIVAFDNRPVRSPDELTRLVTSGPIDRAVTLEYVLPGGTSRQADVRLQALERSLEDALVGPPSPTATVPPRFEPGATPAIARRPETGPDASRIEALETEVRDLKARLEMFERRLESASR